jgi:mono/diheme cytochrome c family protein
MRRILRGVALVALATSLCLVSVPLLADQKPIPPILTESLVGPDLYRSYCASCHGADGKGQGPVASILKVPPADLTTLARRHDGKFPAALVQETLYGTRPPNTPVAHGTSEMPLWGAIFRQLDAKESVAKVRVDNLVKYLASIQIP